MAPVTTHKQPRLVRHRRGRLALRRKCARFQPSTAFYKRPTKVKHAITELDDERTDMASVKTGQWHKHPAVRSGDQLTFGERAADVMRNGMGSWTFVRIFFGVMILWAGINTFYLSRVVNGNEFDPFPYILLNLFLSMLAGVQAAALLIAAKRQDAISSELAVHDDQLLTKNTDLINEIHGFSKEAPVRTELLELLCVKAGIPQDQIDAVLSKAGLDLAKPATKQT
jgi:uncharacterized membrane protein